MNILWRRSVIWGILAGLLALGLVYAFRPQAVPVDLIRAARGPLLVSVDEEGETRVKDVYVLSAPVSGRALRIDAEVGDPVAANETVVARIEPIDPAFLDLRSETQAQAAVDAAKAARTVAAAELERAEAELDYARAEFRRAEGLVRGETISERAYDRAKLNLRAAQAVVATARASLRMRDSELEQARAQLLSPVAARRDVCECVSITSPVAGRILGILHKSEGVVQAGDPLAEIGNPGDLEIVTDLLSSDAVRVVPGQRVVIEDWGGEEPLSGTVQRVEPTGFTKVSALGIEEQRVNVVIDFTGEAAAWRRLGHGYRVEARIVIWESDSVLKLPLSALFRQGEVWSVFVEEDGRARRRAVTLGRLSGREAEIAEGLAEGETVVLHPSDRVVDGLRIVGRS